jgi:hypothetical protein
MTAAGQALRPHPSASPAPAGKSYRRLLFYLPANLKPLPAARLENAIYMSAGIRPWARDPVDFKIISDVGEGRGRVVDSEAQSSGYPAYAPTRRAFDPAEWNLTDMSLKAGWDSLFRYASRRAGAHVV